MKIKLQLSALESRENPTASPFGENSGFSDGDFFFEGSVWYEDTNPLPDVAPQGTRQVNGPDLMTGNGGFDNAQRTDVTPVRPPIHDTAVMPGR